MSPATPAATAACPCGRTDARGRPLPLGHCCGPWLGGAPAPDAESLMRSRYTAFVLHDEAYLLESWHPSRRPERVAFEPGLKWLGLDVREHRVTGADRAEVEFVARSRLGGRAGRLHERSRFVLEGGRWYYVDGDLR
jgi:SEC-C motif-containing protein